MIIKSYLWTHRQTWTNHAGQNIVSLSTSGTDAQTFYNGGGWVNYGDAACCREALWAHHNQAHNFSKLQSSCVHCHKNPLKEITI